MATNIVWIPTSNVLAGGDYTGVIQVGTPRQEVTVILDSGSSTLGIGVHKYNPEKDTAKSVTDYAQAVFYGSGSWYGGVLETTVTLGSGSSTLQVPKCYVAAAAKESAAMFQNAGGILGLAYIGLNQAFKMAGPTWPLKYTAKQIETTGARTDLPPYFTQLTQGSNIADMFGFYALRSWPRLTMADPTQDPMNQGWLILGGGPESTALYTGQFQNAKVVGDDWYDTNLTTVIVGNQPPITVAPAPASAPGQPVVSNSIIDSGTNGLSLDGGLYQKIVAAFVAINPAFSSLIQQGGPQAGGSVGTVPNGSLNLAEWPVVQFVLEGETAPVTLSVTPENYWQTDAIQKGSATFAIDGTQTGQSILGLPMFNGYFTVFDQTGTGTIRFATIAPPVGSQLPQPGPLAVS